MPPLLFILRTSTLPTPLRSSALTILATTFESSPLALLPHADVISEACLTLLSVESRPLQPRRRQQNSNADVNNKPIEHQSRPPGGPTIQDTSDDSDSDIEANMDESIRAAAASLGLGDLASSSRDKDKQKRPEETPDPVQHIDVKHPALRRAAILVLGLLWRAAGQQETEGADTLSSAYRQASIPLVGGFKMPGAGAVAASRTPSSSARGSIGLMLLSRERRARMQTVLRYVHETDEDSLVRHQAGQVLDEMLE